VGVKLAESNTVFKAGDLLRNAKGASVNPWKYASLIGQLSELSEEIPSGAIGFVAELIAEAQRQGEPAAWVAGRDSIFYPPDLAECGVDLDGVTVVWAKGATRAMIAADQLLRSGAFGFLTVDLGREWRVSDAALGKLRRLAEMHEAAVVFLTEKKAQEQSIGSMISLRGIVAAGPHGAVIHTTRNKHGTTGSAILTSYVRPGMH